MKRLLLLTTLLLSAAITMAQPVLIQRDNGTKAGAHFNTPSFTNESVIVSFDGPCKVLEIQIYYMGDRASKDTLFITGDASEGAIPPTHWVWSYNTLIPPIIVNYDGAEGWKTIDLRSLDLRSDGHDRIVVQHWVQSPAGPWFGVDSDKQTTPYWSFLMDPTKTNSLGGPGQYYLVQNDFMVRVLVEYDFPDGNGSEDPPLPVLPDVAVAAGLQKDGNPINSAIAGVADWNGDGWDDIAIGSNYFQNNGDGTFTNVTASLGLPGGHSSWGDFDNDGREDVYIVNGGDNDKLLRNAEGNTFEDVTAGSGLSNPAPTVTPIWLDYNGDGHLDLFLANGRRTVNNQEVYYQDKLWKNNGDGTFTDVTSLSGIAAVERSPYEDCWGASACDYNNDGYTDIFVSTYRLAPDRLYRNNGDGTFTDVGALSRTRGVETDAPQYFGHGMGSDWGDFNNDGLTDLVVGNLGHPDWRGAVSNPSLIYMNMNGSIFDEVHHEMGLKFREMNAGVTWADLDLDGWLDLWQSQYSYQKEGQDGEPGRYSRLYISEGAPNFKLLDRTWHYGSKVHGAWTVARCDFDRDGDIDLLVASQHEGVKLFRNDIPRRGNWLALRLGGSPEHHVPMNAFGTRVVVYADGHMFTRTLSTSSAGSRVATNTTELHFGLGNAAQIDSAVVYYPNATRMTLTTLEPNKRYELAYGGQPTVHARALAAPASWSIENAALRNGTLSFTLHDDHPLEDAQIAIFDALGRQVVSMQTVQLQPGIQSIALPVHLARGMHFVSLRARNTVRTIKLSVYD
ncbi:MAG: VCBS repeat-containing protein [Bacteroidetes bacterium]|nr:VCBS repeat-containing protein [Bacteroidota bacterium]